MRAIHLAKIAALVPFVVACTEPQTPDGAGAPGTTGAATGTGAPMPTLTAVPTGASSLTETPPAPTATSTAAGTADKLTAPYVLTFRQTGGIAGFFMETIIDTAQKRITYGGLRNQSPQSKELTSDEIGRITFVLEQARFRAFPGKIKSGPVSDAFNYDFKLATGGATYELSWSDGATVPDAYLAIREAVNAVRVSKFDGAPSPKGAPTM